MPTNKSPVARILNLLKLERKEIIAVYFYAILNGLIQLSLPVGVQAIIGYALGASMRASLVVLIVLIVLGVLVSGIMQVNQMKIIEKIQQKLFVRYSFAYINHIPALDLKKTDNIYLPELMNRFLDVPVLQKSLSKILLDIPTASIQILFGMILLSFYHPAFILFGLILLVTLLLILRYTGSHGLQTSIEESTYKYRAAAWLQETARVIKSIKLAKKNDLHLQKMDNEVSNYLNARNSHFRVLLFQYNTMVLFKTAVTAAMLIVGTLLLVNQQLNVGQFIAAEIVIIMVLNSVEKLIINLASVYDTLTANEKITKVTDKPVETNGTEILEPAEGGLKLEMKNLNFSYDDVKNVLQDTSLLINANETVCIRGKNSAGKSTLLKVMAGAYTDFSGAYLVNDVPVGNYNLDTLRGHTGVLISQQDIFLGSLRENITLGNESVNIEAITGLSAKVGLNDFVATLPNGYDTMLDPTGKRLSRSVIHKILLVRALINKPRLLLLEEPWRNCGEEDSKRIMQLLLELEDCTVVIVSDDEHFAKHCSQVIELNENGTLLKSSKQS